MSNITVNLDKDIHQTLLLMAEREFRHPRMQAKMFLEQAIRQACEAQGISLDAWRKDPSQPSE